MFPWFVVTGFRWWDRNQQLTVLVLKFQNSFTQTSIICSKSSSEVTFCQHERAENFKLKVNFSFRRLSRLIIIFRTSDSAWWDIDNGKLFFFRPKVWDTSLKWCRYLQDQLKVGFIHRGCCVGVIGCSAEKYYDFRDNGTWQAEETLLLLTKALREESKAFVLSKQMWTHLWFTFVQLWHWELVSLYPKLGNKLFRYKQTTHI